MDSPNKNLTKVTSKPSNNLKFLHYLIPNNTELIIPDIPMNTLTAWLLQNHAKWQIFVQLLLQTAFATSVHQQNNHRSTSPQILIFYSNIQLNTKARQYAHGKITVMQRLLHINPHRVNQSTITSNTRFLFNLCETIQVLPEVNFYLSSPLHCNVLVQLQSMA